MEEILVAAFFDELEKIAMNNPRLDEMGARSALTGAGIIGGGGLEGCLAVV